MIAVSIPAMAKSLGESPLRLNLVITSYLLSLAVFIPALCNSSKMRPASTD